VILCNLVDTTTAREVLEAPGVCNFATILFRYSLNMLRCPCYRRFTAAVVVEEVQSVIVGEVASHARAGDERAFGLAQLTPRSLRGYRMQALVIPWLSARNSVHFLSNYIEFWVS
jgi:hypothetical protein